MRRPSRSVLVLWSLTALFLLAGAWSAGAVGVPFQETIPETLGLQPVVAPEGTAAAPEGVLAPEGPAAQEGVTVAAPEDATTATPGAQGAGGSRSALFDRLRAVLGLLLLGGIAWSLSSDRRRIPWRIVIWGLALQFGFALFILKTPMGAGIFDVLNTLVVALLGFTVEGARFIFGDLVFNAVPIGQGEPGMAPMAETPGMVARTGAFFAFNVLPTIIFFSSLMSLLYHLGIMQVLVKGVAWVMQRTMGTSGAETLSAAGNIFVGQTEAPLLVKPFVARMTNSELMAVMTGGFATVAGGVLAAFVGMLVAYFPDIAGHLIAASVMSAPAALLVAKIMVPEDGIPETRGGLAVDPERRYANTIDAAAGGAGEGLHLALNVGAMLLAFIAIIAMLNAGIGWMGGLAGLPGLSLQMILGWVLAPLAWMMGVPWQDAFTVASLMGLKTVLNEFVAYLELSALLGSGVALEPRSVIIATYALSGFANFSSIAIQIGGIGGIAPNRRADLSRLGLRAMIGGSIAAFMTATIAGILL